jgi:hypothetical protein
MIQVILSFFKSFQQGKMFLYIGVLMTLIQGGYVRRIKHGNHIKATIKAIMLLIPSFVIIGVASNQLMLYAGLLFYCYSSAVFVPCVTTIVSNYGNKEEIGTISGINRSLGALARALGPTFSSLSNFFSSSYVRISNIKILNYLF